MQQPLIIQYTNLLHKHSDPSAKEVRKFREKHATDKVFQKRADVLDKMFALKNATASA